MIGSDGSRRPLTDSDRTGQSSSVEILRIGVVVTGLLFVQSPILASDGFVLGKVLLLGLAATAALGVYVAGERRLSSCVLDWVLLAYLFLGGLSVLSSMSSWNAAIVSTGSTASIALFWTARSISALPYRAALFFAVAGAVALVALSALIEAHTSIQFSTRPPGGTIGNRNRMAHLIVTGLPVLAFLTTRVRNRWMLGLLLLGVALSGSVLFLSRARGAWLAFIAVVLAVALLSFFRRRVAGRSLRGRRTTPRLALFGAAGVLGILAALVIPNQLNWASPTPYRDTAATLLEYQSGTGAGRVTEYRNTLKMIADHPILGVGPGNWRIAYPNYATPGDPNVQPGYAPVRRYPQGEWIGIAAERGIPSLLLLFTIGGVLAWRWLRAIAEERSHRKVGYAYVGLLTMVAVFMVGLFDPVLMTPTAGFVVPMILGVCAAPFAKLKYWTPAPATKMALVSAVLVAGFLLVSFPAREHWAAMIYAKRPTLANFERGARIAPGDYRAHFFAASTLVQRGDCYRAAPYIAAARRLYPTAPAVVQLENRCVEILAGPTPSEGDDAAYEARSSTPEAVNQ